MLKQHIAEIKQLPLVTTPRIVQAQECAKDEARVLVRAKVPAVPHRFSPLYLSRRQLVMAFVLPLLCALLMAGMLWAEVYLPSVIRYGEAWTYLHVSLFTLFPLLLCLWVGYSLRNRRIATLVGTFAGVLFYLPTRLCFWLFTDFTTSVMSYSGSYTYPRYLHFQWFPTDMKELINTLLLALILTFAAAVASQIKHGRRTMHDKDSNR